MRGILPVNRIPWIMACLLALIPATDIRVDAQQAGRETRPNILFIFTDDHGAQTISAYGSNRNRTPNMDRLATGGMRFANCFCTNSICAPSRATVITGKHTHITGHTTNERIFDNRQQTFPKLLQQAGFETALIGKWHLNVEPTGFDYWDILINQGVYYNPPMIRNGQYMEHEGYTTDIITDLTLEWLQNRRDAAKPFLLLSQHKAPHREWDPALRHLGMFRDTLLPEPPTLFDDWSNRSSAWTKAEMSINHLWPRDLHLVVPDFLLTPKQRAVWDSAYGPANEAFRKARLAGTALTRWKYQRFAKDYLRTVASVDEGIGRVLDYLHESGLAKNTVVIYSSDQGWFLGEHGMFDKRWMYEETFRMPLLVRWPGVVKPGSVNADLVQNVDFAPTLLELAGVPVPPEMQGKSLVPLLKGTTPPDWRRSVYYQFFEDEGAHKVPRHYGVRTDRYKLIHFYKLDEWELFDLKNDPQELNSLYGKPGYEQVTAELKEEIRRLQGEANVTADADREVDVFQKHQQARWKFLSLLGKLPSRWNVKFETVRVEEFADYHRELLRYTVGAERIEAFVLVPKRRTSQLPAILALHPGREGGTYEFGKSRLAGIAGSKQFAFAADLCRKGYVVMIPDRFGFESRRNRGAQPEAATEDARVAEAARSFLVNGSTMLGQQLMEFWVATDYLAKRPEVHYTRIGAMGYGEGGLLASLLSYINEEIWATVSIDGVRRFADWKNDAGVCDLLTVPGLQSWGDIDLVLASMYPRPHLALTSSGSVDQLFSLADKRYRDLDYSERNAYKHFGLQRMQLSSPMRVEAFAWLDRWLKW